MPALCFMELDLVHLVGQVISRVTLWGDYKFITTLGSPSDDVSVYVPVFSSVQLSRSVMSDALQPHESQHTRPPCSSPSPRVHSD